jgi:hypothetical protein
MAADNAEMNRRFYAAAARMPDAKWQAPRSEYPRRVASCFRALGEGVVGEAKAAEILGLSVREPNRRMDQPGNGLIHSIWPEQ